MALILTLKKMGDLLLVRPGYCISHLVPHSMFMDRELDLILKSCPVYKTILPEMI